MLSEYSLPRRRTRAFNASGLKVIFTFLLVPQLVSETYRTIAETSGVLLGTIGWVLNDLKELGYVHEWKRRSDCMTELKLDFNSIDPIQLRTYEAITRVASEKQVPFIIVGASIRPTR